MTTAQWNAALAKVEACFTRVRQVMTNDGDKCALLCDAQGALKLYRRPHSAQACLPAACKEYDKLFR